MAAVLKRNRDGSGQYLDISMLDCAMTMNPLFYSSFIKGGEEPRPGSNLLNGGSLYGYYETSDRRYFAVGSLEPKFRNRMLEQLGLSDLPPQVAPTELKQLVTNKFKEKPFAYWVTQFSTADACVEPVLTPDEALNQPQTRARGTLDHNQRINNPIHTAT